MPASLRKKKDPSQKINLEIVEPSVINSTDAPTVTRSGRQVTKNPRYFNAMHANSAYLDTFSPDESVSEGASLLQLGHDSSQEPHPLALLTEYALSLSSSTDPDTMTFDDARSRSRRIHQSNEKGFARSRQT